MLINNKIHHSLLPVIVLAMLGSFLASLLPATSRAEEKIELSTTFPRWGQTPETLIHCWADLAYQLTNRSEDEGKYIFRAQSLGRSGTVFEALSEIGPRAKSHYRLPLISVPGDKYNTDIRRPGRNAIEKQEISTQTTTPFGKSTIFVINDSHDLNGISEIKDLSGVARKIKLTQSESKTAPAHLLDYGGASILVILDINPADWNASQWQAVKDFAATGGTVIFADPRSIMKIADTPLADLLPMQPLELRPVSFLPVPAEWTQDSKPQPVEALYTELSDIRQIDFEDKTGELLVGEKFPEARITARAGSKPLFYWRSFGVGRVGVCTVSPFDDNILNDDLASAIWNHIISRETPPPFNKNTLHTRPVRKAMERLAGFQAPPAKVIYGLAGLYAGLLFLVFALGWYTDKKLQSWLAAGALSIVLTAAVFVIAYQQSRERPSRMVSSIALSMISDDEILSEEMVGIFSKSDLKTSISGNDDKTRLRPIPPVPGPHVYETDTDEGLFTIRYEKGKPAIPELNVRALRAKKFSSFGQQAKEKVTQESFQITNNEEGLRMTSDYKLPASLPRNTRAYLLLNNGVIRVNNRGGKLDRLLAGKGADQFSPVQNELFSFLDSGKLPSPSLALVSQSSQASSAFTLDAGDFSRHQHLIRLFPVDRNNEGDTIGIHPQDISIHPADKAAETMYWQDEWQEKSLRGGESVYHFNFALPPSMSNLEISELIINLSLFNPTGNVVTDFRIIPWAGQLHNNQDYDSDAITADEIKDGQYRFNESLKKSRIVNPVTGHIRIKLVVSTNNEQGTSESTWRILDLSAHGRGEKISL
ncbi:MAG: hypothetical protein ACOCQP_01245 [Lentisphaeria bacterium]